MPEAGGRRDALVAGAIFALALLVRGLHLREVALHDPYWLLPTVDDVQYDAWARRFVEGRGLVDGVLYLGPGYPLFMALVYAFTGASLAAVKIVQTVLGAGTCVLVWGLTREIFDRRAALVAGAIAACHAMLVFYGATIMTVNLKVPLVLGCAWSLARALRRPGPSAFAVSGLLLGLAVLVQQTALPLLFLVLPWILFAMADAAPLARRVHWSALFAAGTFVVLLPFTLHNLTSGHDLVLLNSMGGPNFYMGNRAGADGTWQLPDLGFRVRADNPDEMQVQFEAAAERATGRPMKPSEISRFWLVRGLEAVRADPLRWLGLELRKLALHFNAYEVWNIRSIEISRESSWVLRLPLVTTGALLPLGLLGVVLSLDRWRRCAPLYGVIAVYLASSLLFFVLARYRIPGMVAFMPFAGFALVRIGELARDRALPKLAAAGVALALFAAFVHLPLESSAGRMHMAWYNLGNKYRELERWDEAIAAYHAALREQPNALSTLNNLALAYELGGRREEAIRTWRQVGQRAARTGDRLRSERAERHLQALEADPLPEPAD